VILPEWAHDLARSNEEIKNGDITQDQTRNLRQQRELSPICRSQDYSIPKPLADDRLAPPNRRDRRNLGQESGGKALIRGVRKRGVLRSSEPEISAPGTEGAGGHHVRT